MGIFNVEISGYFTTQILRQINFGHLEAQKTEFWKLLTFSSVKYFQK